MNTRRRTRRTSAVNMSRRPRPATITVPAAGTYTMTVTDLAGRHVGTIPSHVGYNDVQAREHVHMVSTSPVASVRVDRQSRTWHVMLDTLDADGPDTTLIDALTEVADQLVYPTARDADAARRDVDAIVRPYRDVIR